METTTTTLILIWLLVAAVAVGYYHAQKAWELDKELKLTKFDRDYMTSEYEIAMKYLETTKNETYRLTYQLHQYELLNKAGDQGLKVVVNKDIAAHVAKVNEAYKSIKKVDSDLSNETMVADIQTMLDTLDVTKDLVSVEWSKAKGDDVMSDAAFTAAYVLKFMVNYKEVK